MRKDNSMLPAANLLGLQRAVQYHLISGNWHANNCLSINESFRVKCEEFQYLVSKIGLLPLLLFIFCSMSLMSRACMNTLFCGRRSDEALRKDHVVNAGYLFLTSVKTRKLQLVMSHQHFPCPDWLAMGEIRPSIFISLWLTDFLTTEWVCFVPLPEQHLMCWSLWLCWLQLGPWMCWHNSYVDPFVRQTLSYTYR